MEGDTGCCQFVRGPSSESDNRSKPWTAQRRRVKRRRISPTDKLESPKPDFDELPDVVVATILELLPPPDVYSSACVCRRWRTVVMQMYRADIVASPETLGSVLSSDQTFLLRPGRYVGDLKITSRTVAITGLGDPTRVHIEGSVSCSNGAELTLRHVTLREAERRHSDSDVARVDRSRAVFEDVHFLLGDPNGHSVASSDCDSDAESGVTRASAPRVALRVSGPTAQVTLSRCTFLDQSAPDKHSLGLQALQGSSVNLNDCTLTGMWSPVRLHGPGTQVALERCLVESFDDPEDSDVEDLAQHLFEGTVGLSVSAGAELAVRSTQIVGSWHTLVEATWATVRISTSRMLGIGSAVRLKESVATVEDNMIAALLGNGFVVQGSSGKVKFVAVRNQMMTLAGTCANCAQVTRCELVRVKENEVCHLRRGYFVFSFRYNVAGVEPCRNTTWWPQASELDKEKSHLGRRMQRLLGEMSRRVSDDESSDHDGPQVFQRPPTFLNVYERFETD